MAMLAGLGGGTPVGRAERGDPGAVLGRVLAGEQGQVAGRLRRGDPREGAGGEPPRSGPAQGVVAQALWLWLFRSPPVSAVVSGLRAKMGALGPPAQPRFVISG